MNTRLILVFIATAILGAAEAVAQSALPFTKTEIASFNRPWAMTFLPDGRLLVTEKPGHLLLVTQNGDVSAPISGVPAVDYQGQGGLGDIILHPNFSTNNWVYLSFVEAGESNTRGAAVARATLAIDEFGNGSLNDLSIIWRQHPKVTGAGHYGHRMVFDEDGFLFISSSERQKFDPAQDMTGNLGKIVRLHDDGSVPSSNPFFAMGGVSAQIWSLGHRNVLGLAFDAQGRLWNTEMGPLHGDELNLVKRALDYGYPTVSNGDHYSGEEIPDHDTRPEFEAPKAWWTPTIAPAEIIFYSGEVFPQWQNSALIAGLKSEAIIRVTINGNNAVETERFDMGARIRELEQGPDGAVWVLEDGSDARLLKLEPNATSAASDNPVIVGAHSLILMSRTPTSNYQ